MVCFDRTAMKMKEISHRTSIYLSTRRSQWHAGCAANSLDGLFSVWIFAFERLNVTMQQTKPFVVESYASRCRREYLDSL